MGPWLRRRIPLFVLLAACALFAVLAARPERLVTPDLEFEALALLALALLTFVGWAVFGTGAVFLVGVTRYPAFRRAARELGVTVEWTFRGPRCRGRIGEVSVDVGQDGRPCHFTPPIWLPAEENFPDGAALFDSRTAHWLKAERARLKEGKVVYALRGPR